MPCTDDVCTDGVCENPPTVGCCTSDAQCDDGVACTDDSCKTSKCFHSKENNLCCVQPGDCNDNDPCTDDVCAANACINAVKDTPECGCIADLLCDDNNPCTSDQCASLSCQYAPVDGADCCVSDADCDDGNTKTFDQCQESLCWSGPASCSTDMQCTSPSACLSGTCVGGACAFVASAGCCEADHQCSDGQPQTADACVANVCVHTLGAPSACAANADCAVLSSACAVATCQTQAGVCTFAKGSAANCCSTPSECAAPTGCSLSTCQAFTCGTASAGDSKVVWKATFDAGSLNPWTASGSSSTVKWQVTQVQAISKPWSLYFGQLPQLGYPGSKSSGTVTSGEITPPDGEWALHFQRNLDIEPIFSKDQIHLDRVFADGSVETIWDKTHDMGIATGWKKVELDMTGKTKGKFRLRFTFDAIDGVSNTSPPYDGVFIDDIEIRVPCQ